MIRRIRWQVKRSANHWLVSGANAPTETFIYIGNRVGWEKAVKRAFKEAHRGMDEVS